MVKIKKVMRPNNELVKELIEDIRKPDLKELLMTPVEPFQAVWESIDNSMHCYAVRDSGKHLLAIFGIGLGRIEVANTMATPVWFLGTNRAYKHNKALVFYGRQFCERFISEVGPLCNYIWVGNEPAIRYISHLGATLFDVAPMGKNGELFVPFILSEVIR